MYYKPLPKALTSPECTQAGIRGLLWKASYDKYLITHTNKKPPLPPYWEPALEYYPPLLLILLSLICWAGVATLDTWKAADQDCKYSIDESFLGQVPSLGELISSNVQCSVSAEFCRLWTRSNHVFVGSMNWTGVSLLILIWWKMRKDEDWEDWWGQDEEAPAPALYVL